MRLVVGLGNPGDEYERTRHNLGWLALDALAERLGVAKFRRESTVETAEGCLSGEKVYLVKPMTYMNRSGQALGAWLGRFRELVEALREEAAPGGEKVKVSKSEAEDDKACVWPRFLVITDDVNLQLGRMRFRPSGSAGGHNGLKDIEKLLGGIGYPRLRLGVGQPKESMDRADYVLSRFGSGEMPLVRDVALKAALAVEDWAALGMDRVRAKYNGLIVGGQM